MTRPKPYRMPGLPCDVGTTGRLSYYDKADKFISKEEGWVLAGYVYWSINCGSATPFFAHESGKEQEGGNFLPDA